MGKKLSSKAQIIELSPVGGAIIRSWLGLLCRVDFASHVKSLQKKDGAVWPAPEMPCGVPTNDEFAGNRFKNIK